MSNRISAKTSTGRPRNIDFQYFEPKTMHKIENTYNVTSMLWMRALRLFKKICLLLLLFQPLLVLSQVGSSSRENTTALRLLNKARKDAGLDTVTISASLSRDCYNHAKYLVFNRNDSATQGLSGHKEYASLKGYSKEGEKAGRRSVIAFEKTDRAINEFLASFYHRIPLLQPNLKEIGIAFYEENDYVVSLIDCASGTAGQKSIEVVFYPGVNQRNIRLNMANELPNPAGLPGQFGFPVTIYFTKAQVIKNVKFKLTDKYNRIIDCYISTPENPATFFTQWNTVCAIPKKPLAPDSKYFVSLTCLVNNVEFNKIYSFVTERSH